MADRIEYEGVPLPSGLPGFGGGTVEVLILPGFNTVVAPLQFGPVVDAINANPPDPTPPSGSNPDDPTDEVVDPGPPPPGPGGGGGDSRVDTLCNNYDCTSDPDLGQPFVYAQKVQDPICTACDKASNKYYPNFFTAANSQDGIYYAQHDKLQGKYAGKTWNLDSYDGFNTDNDLARLKIGTDEFSNGAKLDKDKVMVSGTEYRKGAKIYDIDTGRLYEPQALEVCEGGQTKTWYVLAYKE